MTTRFQSLIGLILVLIALVGCTGKGDKPDPVVPGENSTSGPQLATSTGEFNYGHMLLGFWQFAWDYDRGEFDLIPLRHTPMHVNVVQYMQKPANLGVKVVSQNVSTGEFTVDVKLTHPFPNTDLMGFDVRGIVFGQGPSLMHAKDDPDLMWLQPGGLRLDNADGWTRWWNQDEFTTPGLFGYTEGSFGAKGGTFDATLNPYKYFANALDKDDPVVPYVDSSNRGSFATNMGPVERRYELAFPLYGGVPDITFQYAIDACWAAPSGGGAVPDIHDYPPEANCSEPFHLAVDTSESTTYYENGGGAGGDIIINLEVFDWGAIDGIVDDVSEIIVESATLFPYYVVASLDYENGSTSESAIYKITIPNATPTGYDDQEVMIAVKGPGSYQPPAPGYKYPTGEDLTAYAVATVPIAELEPEYVGGFNGGGSGEIVDVKIIDGIAYALDTVDGLIIASIANPQNPVIIKTVPLMYGPIALDVEEGYCWIIGDTGLLEAVDVDPIQNASVAGSILLTGTLVSVASAWPYGYVGTQSGNLHIIDIDPPTGMSLLNTVPIACIGPANEVRVVDGYAYVGDDLDIVDVDPPGSASSVKTVNTSATILSVDYDEATDYLYLGNNTNSMLVMDASDPLTTHLVDSINLGGPVNGINVQNDLIYAAVGNDGLRICAFDETTENAAVIGNVALSNPLGVTSYKNHAFLVDNGMVQVVKVWNDVPIEGWGFGAGSTASEWGNEVAVDGAGNIYMVGEFQGTVDFDPGSDVYNLTSAGANRDCFLVKYDSDGIFQWARGWGGVSGHELCRGVVITGNDYIYIGGSYYGVVNFDSTGGSDFYSSNGQDDCFISKYDLNGNYIATLVWGGYGSDAVLDLATDGNNNIYACGGFSEVVIDFDPGGGNLFLSSNGGFDAFITKFNSSDLHQWAYGWGSASNDQSNGVTCTNSTVFVTGHYLNTVDFDPTGITDNRTSNGGQDCFLVKYSNTGAYTWTRAWGGTSFDEARKCCTRGSGVMVVTGEFTGTVDFDPGVGVDNRSSNGGSTDNYLVEYTEGLGDYAWVKTWGGSLSADMSYNVDIDGFGAIYVTGMVAGDCDFDNEGGGDVLSGLGSADTFLTKYNSSGQHVWARRFGGSTGDINYGKGIHVGVGIGYVYVTGQLEGMVDLDPTPDFDWAVSVNGTSDIFLFKTKLNGLW